jgi:Activator of Hsp90 ATPase homolog 1-like protein
MASEMTITYSLVDAKDGTDLSAVHENLPRGLSSAENELGWKMSIEKLARLVEGRN